MKTILLYANNDEGRDSRFAAALAWHRVFDSHIECVHVTPFDAYVTGDLFGGVYSVPALLANIREAAEEQRKWSEERFRKAGASWNWTPLDGNPGQAIVDRSRIADLVIINLAMDGSAGGRDFVLAADVVLHAKPPVLLVPPGAEKFAPDGRAMVAWDGSTEAAHAVRQNLSVLAAAARVDLVGIDEDPFDYPASTAAAYLRRHGIDCKHHEWPREGRSTALALADAAGSLGADYVVMGAYGHSKLREAIFGGTTRDMLRSSPYPLLVAH